MTRSLVRLAARRALAAVALALSLSAAPAQAHEFWIEPEDWTVAPGEALRAAFRNGELFAGSTLSYVPGWSERLDLVAGGARAGIPARMGDRPAVTVEDPPEGLAVIVHETAAQSLTYGPRGGMSGWERVEAFAAHKDLGWMLAAHDARGLPREGVRELYHRYARALAAVGDGAGDDAPTGMRHEIVALANPYADDVSGGLPVRVLLDGAPRAGAQVEIFARRGEDVVVTLARTDADGVAVIPVEPGVAYLLDAVAAEEAGVPEADWRTLWASLTFAVPQG
jgi:hypothetical protein